MPPREGAFSANFTPEILDRFRELCKQQSKSYSKVLERLAELYLETDGAVLNSSCVPTPKKHSKPTNESGLSIHISTQKNDFEQIRKSIIEFFNQ